MQHNTLSGLPKLSGDYNKGYSQAIQDITEIFAYIQPDLKRHHKSLNGKQALALLKCILDNREDLREQKFYSGKKQGFIRYNGQLETFEYYKPKHD